MDSPSTARRFPSLSPRCVGLCYVLTHTVVVADFPFTLVQGGYFVWVQLPAWAPYTAKQLLDVASSKFGVSFHEGDKYEGLH